MPKRLFKKYLPDKSQLITQKKLAKLSHFWSSPHSWHINRHSIAKAMAIGFFVAFLPIPFQMLIACVLALFFQANVPLSIVLVWLSNPITIPPILYLAYLIGQFVLSHTPEPFLVIEGWNHWFSQITSLWQPILMGLLLLSLASSMLAYTLTQTLWKLHIRHKWRKRQNRSHSIL